MKASDYIVEELKKINDRIFLLVGGGSMHLNDSVGRLMPYTCTHHEQAAAIAAEGYARMTGKPGLCMVTSGPGVTNAITGLYGAYTDSIPMIFVSGQMKTQTLVPMHSGLRQLGDQEVNAVKLVGSLTKLVLQPLPDLWDIKYCIQKLHHIATTERPGPVWLDVPLDIQAMEVDPSTMSDYSPDRLWRMTPPQELREVAYLLQTAKRPLIIAGHGIRLGHGEEIFREFIQHTKIPFVPSFNSLDLEYPRRFGPFGTIGTNAANTLVQEADVLLILGCRMNIRQVGYEFGKLGRQAKTIMVDIDEAELMKHTFIPDIKISTYVQDFLGSLDLLILSMQPPQDWLDHCEQVAQIERKTMPIHPDRAGFVNPYRVIQALNAYLEPNEVVVSANGMVSIVASQMLDVTKGMRFLVNSGAGAMGYGLPMAIGAAFANKGNRVICLEGDGSLQLNIQELQTVVHHKLPLKIVVLNNEGYNSIKNTARVYFKGDYFGADKLSGLGFPDLGKIAFAYGIKFGRVYNNKDLPEHMTRLFEHQHPMILEVMGDPNSRPMPKGIKY